MARHEEDSLEPLKSLLLRKLGPGTSAADLEGIDSLNFAGLREKLLDEAPLDVEWIKQASQGYKLEFESLRGIDLPFRRLAVT